MLVDVHQTTSNARCEIQPVGVQVAAAVANVLAHTAEVINTVRLKTDRVILFYSGGKDSIALLDMIAPHFNEVICVFMYFVKGLEHIDKYLNYARAKYPNVTVLQVPHWILSSTHNTGLWCVPNEKVKLLKLKDIIEYAKSKAGAEYVFLGMKQSDSLNRRLMLRGYELEALNNLSNLVYPLSKWSNPAVEQYIRQRNLPKPIKYTNKKKSQGLTFDLDVYLYLREHYPNDLKKILAQFPLSEQILFEYDHRQGQSET